MTSTPVTQKRIRIRVTGGDQVVLIAAGTGRGLVRMSKEFGNPSFTNAAKRILKRFNNDLPLITDLCHWAQNLNKW